MRGNSEMMKSDLRISGETEMEMEDARGEGDEARRQCAVQRR